MCNFFMFKRTRYNGLVSWFPVRSQSHGVSCHSSEPPKEARKPQLYPTVFTFPSRAKWWLLGNFLLAQLCEACSMRVTDYSVEQWVVEFHHLLFLPHLLHLYPLVPSIEVLRLCSENCLDFLGKYLPPQNTRSQILPTDPLTSSPSYTLKDDEACYQSIGPLGRCFL